MNLKDSVHLSWPHCTKAHSVDKFGPINLTELQLFRKNFLIKNNDND